MSWWPALLGWPAIALSVALTCIGVFRRNERLVFGAVVPIIPISFYILGSPILWWLPIVTICALLVSGLLVRRQRHADVLRGNGSDPG